MVYRLNMKERLRAEIPRSHGKHPDTAKTAKPPTWLKADIAARNGGPRGLPASPGEQSGDRDGFETMQNDASREGH